MSWLPWIPRAFLSILLVAAGLVAIAESSFFYTHFTTIHYGKDKDLSDLVWRLSGHRLYNEERTSLARNRVDEIVDRVQALLGMYPEAFHVDIYLRPYQKPGDIASYCHETRTIDVAVDRVTDGILAHELAHAVINSYFKVPPPRKAQEILAQYVDRQLWGG